MDYKERIKELRDTLNAHSYRYYVLDERSRSGSPSHAALENI